MPRKETKVVVRKLGREKNYGQAWKEDGIIEVDPRQAAMEMLDTLIHEKLHIIFKDWEEKKVATTARKLSRFLWKQGYRKVELK